MYQNKKCTNNNGITINHQHLRFINFAIEMHIFKVGKMVKQVQYGSLMDIVFKKLFDK